MARDRKRAKQRQQRRDRSRGSLASPGQPIHRADLPGALDHVGDVDEFDAALVRGAGGVPLSAEQLGEAENGDAGSEAISIPETGERAHARPERRSLVQRAIGFLRASWAELQRVQWPNRPQVFQATAVVLGFVVVAGLYLGAADWLAQKIVNFIL